MSRWPAYPAYKDAGVAWLGEIPAHWETRRLKYAAAINTGTLSEDTDDNYRLRYVDISSVDSRGNITDVEEMPFEKAPSRARREVRAGDTIISTVRTYLKAIAYIDQPANDLIVSTGFAVLSPYSDLDSKYLWCMVQSQGFVDAVVANSEGIGYPAIAPTKLAELPVWIPPLPEQRAIAAFLDRETAKLDTLMRKFEQLLDRLEEQRAALISHAVTKGLDPDVEMKASGIPWLGEIPGVFTTTKLKRVASIIDGDRGKEYPNENDLVDAGIPFLSSSNIVDNKMDYSNVRFISQEKFDKLRRGKLKADDLVITVRGTIGSVAYFSAEDFDTAFINAQMMILRPSSEISARFLYFVTLSNYWRSQLDISSYGSAQQQLSNEILGNILLSFPSLPEQRAIAAYLDRETARIDALAAKVRAAIEGLDEYRTALISAAVTGKIDVRNEVGCTSKVRPT